MAEYINREDAIAIIEAKQKELCPVGRYGRGYVYGSDREKYDAWDEIIDALENVSAADVVQVVHSYWESYSCSQYMGIDEYGKPKWRDGKFFVCHNHHCRRKTVMKSLYCPNYGAKMDGGADHEAD